MRADKKKSTKSVLKVALREPLLNQDEVAEKAWVSQATVSRVLDRLYENESIRDMEETKEIISDDLVVIRGVQKESVRRIKTPEIVQEMADSDLIKYGAESYKRYTLLTGGKTENVGVELKNYDWVPIGDIMWGIKDFLSNK